MKKHSEIRYSCLFIIFVLSLGLLGYWRGYRLNILTPSAPFGLWRVAPVENFLHRGDYVCVDTNRLMQINSSVLQAHEWGYFGKTLPSGQPYKLLKAIGAVAKDQVIYDAEKNYLFVNGFPVGQMHKTDSKGRLLPALSYPYTVPDGHYWLSSSNEKGFDSRYFGAVPENLVLYRMIPVLIWE